MDSESGGGAQVGRRGVRGQGHGSEAAFRGALLAAIDLLAQVGCGAERLCLRPLSPDLMQGASV